MAENVGGGLSFSEDHGLIWEHISETESDFIFDEIFIRRVYVQNGITVTDGSTIVDVGANIGLFALFFACEAKNLKILCLEPLPPIFHVLKRNLAALMQQNCSNRVLQIAIGNDLEENSQSDFYFFQGWVNFISTRKESVISCNQNLIRGFLMSLLYHRLPR